MSEVERERQILQNLLNEGKSHQGMKETSIHPMAILLWIVAWIILLVGVFLTFLAPEKLMVWVPFMWVIGVGNFLVLGALAAIISLLSRIANNTSND